MRYDFICKICGKKTELDVPMSEYYVPCCCEKKMNRVFYVPGIKPGTLNRNNIPH